MGKQNNQQSSSPHFNLVSNLSQPIRKNPCPQHRTRSLDTTVLCGGDSGCLIWGGAGWDGAWYGAGEAGGMAQVSLLELPLLATHGAVLLYLLCV